jgi:hypothetical protein
MIDYAALRTELLTDPTSIGYATAYNTGQDQAVADLLNAPRVTVDRGLVPTYEVARELVPSEWVNVSAVNRSLYQAYITPPLIDTAHANVRAAFNLIFLANNCPLTRAAMVAVATRQGSRVEKLFGVGTTVSNLDVAIARRS